MMIYETERMVIMRTNHLHWNTLLSKLSVAALPSIRYFTKPYRRILYFAHVFFLVLTVLFLLVAANQAKSVYQQTLSSLQSNATDTGFRVINQINSQISPQFDDLEYLNSILTSNSANHIQPTDTVKRLLTDFQHEHKSISSIYILGLSGHLIWSTANPSTLTIPNSGNFLPLQNDSAMLISTPINDHPLHQWMISLRVKILDNDDHLLGYVGSNIPLSHFQSITTPTDLHAILWDPIQKRMISTWSEGKWLPPIQDNPSLPQSMTSTQNGTMLTFNRLPWNLTMSWNRQALSRGFWKTEESHIPPVLTIFVLIALMDFLTQHFIRRMMRQRFYQQAILSIQQQAITISSPVLLFQYVVDTLSSVTDATLFYIVEGEIESLSKIVAIKPNKLLSGSPLTAPAITTTSQLQDTLATSKNKSLRHMTYLSFPFQGEPASLHLVVGSEERMYFSPPIANLLKGLAYSIGRILTQWEETNLREILQDAFLQESSIRFRMINNIGIGIFLTSLDRTILRANRRITEIFGYKEEELIGENCRFIYENDASYEQFGSFYQQLTDFSNGIIEEQYTFQKKDGTLFTAEVFGALLDPDDPSKGVIWTFQDITEKLAMEEAIQENQMRLQRDLEVAATLQQAFLPHHIPNTNKVNIAWKYIPSDFLAGDMLNIIALDDDHLAFYVLDVMGHGVPAALNAIAINYYLRPMENEQELAIAQHPGKLLTFINERFSDFLITESYFTIFYGVLNLTTLELSYAKGGHPSPILVHEDGTIDTLEEGDMPLGITKGTTFSAYTWQMIPGDKLLVFSDGLTEVFNQEGEMFSTKRVREKMAHYRELGIHELTDRLLDDITSFTGVPQWNDDVTLVGLEMKK